MRVTYVLDHRGSGSIAAQTVVSGIYSFRALLQRNARNTTCIDHLTVQSLEFAEQQFPDALMQWIVTLVDLAQNPGDEHAADSAADDGDNDCDDGFLAHWESFRKENPTRGYRWKPR